MCRDCIFPPFPKRLCLGCGGWLGECPCPPLHLDPLEGYPSFSYSRIDPEYARIHTELDNENQVHRERDHEAAIQESRIFG